MSIRIDDLHDPGIVDGRWEVRDGFFTRTFPVSRGAAGSVESAYLRSTPLGNACSEQLHLPYHTFRTG